MLIPLAPDPSAVYRGIHKLPAEHLMNTLLSRFFPPPILIVTLSNVLKESTREAMLKSGTKIP